jgi:hypothetical protein
MILAFKNAAMAVKLATNLPTKIFSEGIARVTGGEFSHVEIWLSGPKSAARCFAAREPDGTGFTTLDLSDATLWTLVDIPDSDPSLECEQHEDYAWCQGRVGRPYNFPGIVAIELGKPFTAPGMDFCSQCALEILPAECSRRSRRQIGSRLAASARTESAGDYSSW